MIANNKTLWHRRDGRVGVLRQVIVNSAGVFSAITSQYTCGDQAFRSLSSSANHPAEGGLSATAQPQVPGSFAQQTAVLRAVFIAPVAMDNEWRAEQTFKQASCVLYCVGCAFVSCCLSPHPQLVMGTAASGSNLLTCNTFHSIASNPPGMPCLLDRVAALPLGLLLPVVCGCGCSLKTSVLEYFLRSS